MNVIPVEATRQCPGGAAGGASAASEWPPALAPGAPGTPALAGRCGSVQVRVA